MVFGCGLHPDRALPVRVAAELDLLAALHRRLVQLDAVPLQGLRLREFYGELDAFDQCLHIVRVGEVAEIYKV